MGLFLIITLIAVSSDDYMIDYLISRENGVSSPSWTSRGLKCKTEKLLYKTEPDNKTSDLSGWS